LIENSAVAMDTLIKSKGSAIGTLTEGERGIRMMQASHIRYVHN